MSLLTEQLAKEWYDFKPDAMMTCDTCRKKFALAGANGPSVVCPRCGWMPSDKVCREYLPIIDQFRSEQAAKKVEETAEVESPRCDPPGLGDVIGNAPACLQIRTALDANHARKAKGQATVFPHTLLVGPAGSGKTTLAGIIARECKHNLHLHLGQSLNDPRAMVAALSKLKSGDVMFIDEIHDLKKAVTETMYKALEERQVMSISSRGAAPPPPIKLPAFTLIGATTDEYRLSDSFKQRFDYQIDVKQLTVEELSGAIMQRAEQTKVKLDLSAAKMIAERSHGTPRRAVKLLKRCVDTALAGDTDIVDCFIVDRACEMAE